MRSLTEKFIRRAARQTDRLILPSIEETIVSFGFDDCPKSAIVNGLPIIETEGWRATIYVALGLCDQTNHLGLHMSKADIVEVHNRGHEISDHTFSHLSANEVSATDYIADVVRNQEALVALGLPPSRHFAYPYGDVSPTIKKALSTRFETMRGVVSPKNSTQDANLMSAIRFYSNDDSVEKALDQISAAKDTPKWLNFFSHDVRENPSEYGCTEADLKRIVSAIKANGFRVMTVDDAYQTIMKTKVDCTYRTIMNAEQVT